MSCVGRHQNARPDACQRGSQLMEMAKTITTFRGAGVSSTWSGELHDPPVAVLPALRQRIESGKLVARQE